MMWALERVCLRYARSRRYSSSQMVSLLIRSGLTMVAPGMNRGVRILVDGGRKHDPAALLGIGRDVGAAAAERQPKRRAAAHHGRAAPAHAGSPSAASASARPEGVPMSQKRPRKR